MDLLLNLLQPDVLLPWLLGMAFGIFVGATPGLTATMAVALIVPFTFYLPNPNTGLALILGISFSAIFAGDIPAVYLRIPGTPASAAGVLDGHEMAKQGRGRMALMLDLWCSALGGLIGTILLIVCAPQLAKWALRFSHYEYFWLGVAGLGISAVVTQGSPLRAAMAALFGMLLSTIGIDRVSGTPRFTFGQSELTGGLDFIAVMIGLFGLSEVLRSVRQHESFSAKANIDSGSVRLFDVFRTMWKHKLTMIKSSLLGTFIGALPGAGADIAAWASYGLAQRTSRAPKAFGTGCTEGVIAPTTANNAAVAGAWIPMLVFGIPGDSVTAIALGALLMYNIKPGPMIFAQSGPQIQTLFLIALITQVLLLLAGWFGIRAFGAILRLPRSIVLTAVVVFSVVGAYSLRNDLFDVWVMAAAGVAGYFLEARRIPLAPLILGLILGPMIEENLRTGLIKSSGDFNPFVTRPISLSFVVLFALTLFGKPIARLFRRSTASEAVQLPEETHENK
jgi:putative tricarboxylic transport membrane protein